MIEERRFTRDLGLCVETFNRHFPDHAVGMKEALSKALHPPGELQEGLQLLDGIGVWIQARADEWLDKNNSDRAPAMPVISRGG